MKQIRLALLSVMMLLPLVGHAKDAGMRIAVIDSEMAVLESDSAKKYAKDSEALFAPRIKKLKTLQEDIKKIEQQLQKDGPAMTEAQRESKQLEIKRKYEDFQLQDRQLRMDKAKSDQAELGKLRPKLDQAVEKVSQELNYDMVLERGAVRYVKAEFDITRKVIERLNQMK
ncbi:OmpH family outer membrane protein [Endozoicomonas sp. Mp262]|uniref:OmpH family outer membrane protein n=1 Tax=Endozoicomonas sp. Mp262 TaxID=2919499 RepID=UPI0021D9480A